MKTLVIADFSKCYENQHAHPMHLLNRFRNERLLEPHEVFAFLRADQHELAGAFPNHLVVAAYQETSVQLRSVMRVDDHYSKYIVISYYGTMLNVAKHQATQIAAQCETYSFSNLMLNANVVGATSLQAPLGEWDFNHIAPLDDAIDALIRGLKMQNIHQGSRFRQSDVRPLLALVDPRFQFPGSAAESGTSGMIKHIVRSARNRGLVMLSDESPHPFLWPASSAQSTEKLAKTPFTQPQSPTAFPSQDVPSTVSSSNPSLEAKPLAEDSKESVQEHFHRSRQMEMVLRSAGLGPFARARKAIYQELQNGIALLHGEPASLRHLIEQSVARAREGGVTSKIKEDLPWRKIARFTIKLVGLSSIAIDWDGERLGPGVASLRSPVSKFVPDWENIADAELLFQLAVRMPGISINDLENLGGVLYADRGNDGMQRATDLLNLLVNEQHRLAEKQDQNGETFFVVVASQPPAPAVATQITSGSEALLGSDGTESAQIAEDPEPTATHQSGSESSTGLA